MTENELTPIVRKKSPVVENIEPEDFVSKLFPNMMQEHIARYIYAANFAVNNFAGRDEPKILNIASARGYGNDIIETKFPQGFVIGVEYFKKYTDKAHKNYPESTFLQADARRNPITSGSIDMVAAFEITEHLPKEDQEGFIAEISRVLKTGGFAIVSIPEPYSGGLGKNVHHLYEPDSEEMKNYIKNSGLEIVEALGQIAVPQNTAEKMKRLNKVIPIWPIFAWGPSRDVSVRNIPDEKLALTHIFVLKKPEH